MLSPSTVSGTAARACRGADPGGGAAGIPGLRCSCSPWLDRRESVGKIMVAMLFSLTAACGGSHRSTIHWRPACSRLRLKGPPPTAFPNRGGLCGKPPSLCTSVVTILVTRTSDQSPTPSPCTGICELSPKTGFCRGCLRSGEEIAEWRAADDSRRRKILERIATRRAAGFETVDPPHISAK